MTEFYKKKYGLHNQLEYQIIHLLTRKGFWVFPTTKHSDRKISGWLDHPKKTTCISLFLLDSTIGFWSSNYLLNSIYNYPFHWSSKNHRTSFIYYTTFPLFLPYFQSFMAPENNAKPEPGPKMVPVTKPKGWVVLVLRLLALAATASATIVMGLNKETKTFVVATVGTTPIKATFSAKFQHTPAFV